MIYFDWLVDYYYYRIDGWHYIFTSQNLAPNDAKDKGTMWDMFAIVMKRFAN